MIKSGGSATLPAGASALLYLLSTPYSHRRKNTGRRPGPLTVSSG